MSFDIKDWISDPCYLIHWNGISCDNSSSAIRISEIDLSGRNLTGSLPKEIEQLTALVNVSLNNNYLMGPLPNFSNLTMLERLYLQNNNMNSTVPDWLSQLKNLKELSLNNNYLTGPLPNFSNLTMFERIYLQNNNINGTVPEWLSQLKNLKELNIENNNFRGVIPAQLLHNCSLKFKYYNTQKLTEKSDVYSFGVVLLEIICGRQPIDVNLPEDEVNIIRWVTPYVLDMDENPGRIAEIIDKRLDGSYDLKSITCVAKVAMRCVQSAPSLRPSVTEVVRELEKAMKIEYKVSISHDVGIKSSDLLVGSLSLSMDSRGRKGMEWRDNSSNFSKVGR